MVVEAADGREGQQVRLSVALLDRQNRLFRRDDSRLLARAAVFQLHVLLDVEFRRLDARPLRDDLADHLTRLATAGTSLFFLGNIDYFPPARPGVGKPPPAVRVTLLASAAI
jgi:hypothetical protein